MLIRAFGRLVIGSVLMSSTLVPLAVIVTPTAAIAAPKAKSPSVQAIELALKGHFSDAGPLAQRSGDEAAIKLVELLYLRDHWQDAGYSRIMDFLTSAPKWPLDKPLMNLAQQIVYTCR